MNKKNNKINQFLSKIKELKKKLFKIVIKA